MINVIDFYNELVKNEINFYTGIPDSLLKDICAYITNETSPHNHVIAANEGGAIALGCGYYLATGKIPLIYMQNSGLGNSINPLLSLADQEVYAIPMILLIGWRGETGVKDEPQHVKQGRVTPSMLESMEIPFEILDENSDYEMLIKESVENAIKLSKPVAILVRKGTFSSYKFIVKEHDEIQYPLSREQALECVLKQISNDSIIVSTTGMLSRELYEIREKLCNSHQSDFLTVGSMGHASQIALGIALAKPEKKVFCFDGDGAALMHLGNYAIAASLSLNNLKIIVFNNGAHDSVGGQPTICHKLNFDLVAKGFNLKSLGYAIEENEVEEKMNKLIFANEMTLLEIKIKSGSRKDLGRPTTTPIQNKEMLMDFIQCK